MVYSHVHLTTLPPTQQAPVCRIFARATIFSMKLSRGTLVFAVLVLAFLAIPVATHAATLPGAIVPENCSGADAATKCGVCDVAQLAQNILNTAIYLSVFLSAVLFAWAGWESVTAGGNAEKVGHARSIFTNVVIGLVIMLAGWLVVDTLMKTLTNGSFGPWNKVCN